MAHHTAKDQPWISTTRGRPLPGIPPTRVKSRQFFEYRLYGTKNNECRRCTVTSWSTPRKVIQSILGTGSTPEARCMRKACIPFLVRRYEWSGLLLYHVNWKWADRASTRSSGSWTVLSIPPTNQGIRVGRGCPWRLGGWCPLSGSVTSPHKACAWVEYILAIRSKEIWQKCQTLPWRLNTQVPCFTLYPYFGGWRSDHLPYFWWSDCPPPKVPQINATPASSLLQLSSITMYFIGLFIFLKTILCNVLTKTVC